jgi:hypothetical protein
MSEWVPACANTSCEHAKSDHDAELGICLVSGCMCLRFVDDEDEAENVESLDSERDR